MSVDPVVTRRFIEALSTHFEDHLATWKSSLVDAKRDIEALLTAVSEKIPAQARPLLPEDLVGLMLEDVVPPPPKPERIVEKVVEKVLVPAPAAAAPPDWRGVRTSLSTIESARTQVDVLTRFLHESKGHASRVALFVLRGERVTGWKAVGFDGSGGRDDAVKSIDLGTGDDAFVDEVLRRERSMIAEPPSESSALRRGVGGVVPKRTLLVPMVIRDRLAGILLADELPGDEGRLNPAALEALTFATGLVVDLLAARKKIPSPSLTPAGEEIAAFEAEAPAPPSPPEPAFEAEAGVTIRAPIAAFAPEPPPAPPAAPKNQADFLDTSGRLKRRITDAGEALRALEESAAARRRGEPPAAPPSPTPPAGDLTLAFDQLRGGGPAGPAPVPPAPPKANVLRESTGSRIAPAPPAPVPPPAAGSLQESLAGGSATPLAPPAGFVPRSRSGRGDDPQRAAEDAKRLARLLVSEIKLYNERKVDEGRAAGDIYERLKDDIQRSRQVYEERTPESVRATGDYFHDELVRILANGRADLLGPVA